MYLWLILFDVVIVYLLHLWNVLLIWIESDLNLKFWFLKDSHRVKLKDWKNDSTMWPVPWILFLNKSELHLDYMYLSPNKQIMDKYCTVPCAYVMQSLHSMAERWLPLLLDMQCMETFLHTWQKWAWFKTWLQLIIRTWS